MKQESIILTIFLSMLLINTSYARRVVDASCPLKQYDDMTLDKAREIVWQHTQSSPVKDSVGYHNYIHINSLLEFIDTVVEQIRRLGDRGLLLYDIDKIQTLARVATYFHDTGVYIPVDGKCCSKGHEEKSKAIVEAYLDVLGLSKIELEAIQLMIDFTKLKVDEDFKGEAELVDEIIKTIEAQERLSNRAIGYIKNLMPGLDLTNEKDLKLLHDALIFSKVVAIGDIYGYSENYPSQIPGL
ncbi:MAG: hypothetical protein P9L98_00435 [Candidatus Kaelpia imicola]|nr:hypothetical protein [Candidatus Kaelpia imicola]